MPRRVDQPFHLASVAETRDRQAGVVARRQLLAAGACVADVRRLVSRGDLVPWAPGVYLGHRGDPSWLERAWAAVLMCWPAVLDADSALRAEAGPGWRGRSDASPIQVAVDLSRRVRRPHPDVVVRRVSGLAERAKWQSSPPRLRFEEAALDAAMATERLPDGVESLARAVRSRCTTANRLIAVVEQRAKVPGRKLILGVLADVRDGTSSILEHGYLTEIERPHSLPRSSRQIRERLAGGVIYRDHGYEEYDVYVELDGRLDHLDGAARARDLARDLALAVDGRVGIRLGWSQVFHTSCETARAVGQLLNSRGWPGAAQSCGPSCIIAATA